MHLLNGESGGGQMLRTALALSMITGQAFRMTHIRGKRSRPGLMRQHLTCVKASAAISGAAVDGADIGSTEIVFRPGKVRGGDWHFAIGTAGSAGLLFQTLLPALLHADAPSSLRLEGGTHNPMAPPFEFLDRVFLPALARMGAEVSLKLVETGFAPAGGGIIEAAITPCPRLTPCDFRERGELRSLDIRVPVRNLPKSIAERIRDAAQKLLPDATAAIDIREPGPGRGVCVLVEAAFDQGGEMTSAFGEHGVTSERVGQHAAKVMRDYLGTGAAVGRCLADQLLLPMALAGGGAFLTLPTDEHVPTNISVIGTFLPVSIRQTTPARGRVLIEMR
jgi:RNA 3'-terminal phosphate cyclase (ATP)